MAKPRSAAAQKGIDLGTKAGAWAAARVVNTPQITAVTGAFLGGLRVGNFLNFKLIDPALWGENGLLTQYFDQQEAAALAASAPDPVDSKKYPETQTGWAGEIEPKGATDRDRRAIAERRKREAEARLKHLDEQDEWLNRALDEVKSYNKEREEALRIMDQIEDT